MNKNKTINFEPIKSKKMQPRKIKTLSVTVTYHVCIGDITIPDQLYKELLQASQEEAIIGSESTKYSNADQWLCNNIDQNDAFRWAIKIEDLELQNEPNPFQKWLIEQGYNREFEFHGAWIKDGKLLEGKELVQKMDQFNAQFGLADE